MAGAEYSDRSPANETDAGSLHVPPRSVEFATNVRSSFGPWEPSDHAATISSVASVPLGAPFEMSTLGMADRSMRAPDRPSPTHRPLTGSTLKHGSVIGSTSRGDRQFCPPLRDRIIVAAPSSD